MGELPPNHPPNAEPRTAPVLRASFLRDASLESAFVRAALDEHPEYDKLRAREGFVAWLVALVLSGVLAFPLYFFMSKSMLAGGEHILTGVILVCLYPLFVMYFASQMPWRKHYRQHVMPRLGGSPSSIVSSEAERVELEVSSQGMRWKTSEYATEWPWKHFEEVRLFNSHLVHADGHVAIVQAGDISAVVIPAAAFADDAAKQAFVEQARAMLSDAGYSLAARMRFAATAKSKLVCPRCGYSLSNLTTDRCPECSRVLTGFALQCGEWLALSRRQWLKASLFR